MQKIVRMPCQLKSAHVLSLLGDALQDGDQADTVRGLLVRQSHEEEATHVEEGGGEGRGERGVRILVDVPIGEIDLGALVALVELGPVALLTRSEALVALV